MKTKQILFAILIFAAVNASAAVENSDPMNPVVFTLSKQTTLTPPPNDNIQIFKKAPGNKYNFKNIAPNQLEQYIGKPCVVCPLITSIIVDSDNPDQCDPLAIVLLSDRVTKLEEFNKNMAKTLLNQSKFNQDQSKFNQELSKGQSKINQEQSKINQTVVSILKDAKT